MNVLRRHWKLLLATLAVWWLVSVPVTLELYGYSANSERTILSPTFLASPSCDSCLSRP